MLRRKQRRLKSRGDVLQRIIKQTHAIEVSADNYYKFCYTTVLLVRRTLGVCLQVSVMYGALDVFTKVGPYAPFRNNVRVRLKCN